MSISKKVHKLKNKKEIHTFEAKFRKQFNVTPLKKEKNEDLDPLKNSIDQIYIRAKFLFFALTEQIDKKNAFAAYALLKSFWETTALLGYIVVNAEELVPKKEYKTLLQLLRKLIMGGRKFPSDEMVKKKEAKKEEYTQPNVLTMMDRVDKYWNLKFKKESFTSHFRSEYDEFIAEAGHPTYLGLQISGRWSKNKSFLTPDQNKSWNKIDEYQIENYLALAGYFLFYFYDRYLKLVN